MQPACLPKGYKFKRPENWNTIYDNDSLWKVIQILHIHLACSQQGLDDVIELFDSRIQENIADIKIANQEIQDGELDIHALESQVKSLQTKLFEEKAKRNEEVLKHQYITEVEIDIINSTMQYKVKKYIQKHDEYIRTLQENIEDILTKYRILVPYTSKTELIQRILDEDCDPRSGKFGAYSSSSSRPRVSDVLFSANFSLLEDIADFKRDMQIRSSSAECALEEASLVGVQARNAIQSKRYRGSIDELKEERKKYQKIIHDLENQVDESRVEYEKHIAAIQTQHQKELRNMELRYESRLFESVSKQIKVRSLMATYADNLYQEMENSTSNLAKESSERRKENLGFLKSVFHTKIIEYESRVAKVVNQLEMSFQKFDTQVSNILAQEVDMRECNDMTELICEAIYVRRQARGIRESLVKLSKDLVTVQKRTLGHSFESVQENMTILESPLRERNRAGFFIPQ